MDYGAGALEGLVEIAGAAQITDPGIAKLGWRRQDVEAQHLVAVLEKVADGVLSEAAAAAGDHDPWHL